MDFEKFWILVANHGRVAHLYKDECEVLWRSFSPAQQQAIYDAIDQKLQSGRFVHFNPLKAIEDNKPSAPRPQSLSYADYYRRYGTTEETDGWQKRFLPDKQKTIYVK